MATILGVDVSHFQGRPNFAQVKASGREFVVHKVTESTNYVDPMFAANRAAAHAAGLFVGLYHFSRAGNAAAEAAWFLRQIGALQAGEFLVLDQEVPSSVAWCKAWLDAVYAATGVRPLIYMNQSANTGMALGNWSTVAANYGLWLAKYDNSTAQPSVAHWGAPAMKQFSDKGAVPGISGAVDVDVFYGTRDQLLAYCAGGTIQGDDMPLTTDEINAVAAKAANLIFETDVWTGPDGQTTLSDLIRAFFKVYVASDHPGANADNAVGHIVSAHKRAEELLAAVGKLGAAPVSGGTTGAVTVQISDADRAAIVKDVVEALKGLHLQA